MQQIGANIVEVPTVWSDCADGSKVRLAKATRMMLLSLLRLRLERSPIRNVPFFELLARESMIPVKRSLHVLLFGGDRRTGGTTVAALAANLQRAGYEVSFSPDVRMPKLLEQTALAPMVRNAVVILWYIFRSGRGYDALIEHESAWPSIVPSFSAKPSLVLRAAVRSGRAFTLSSAVYALLYRRSATLEVPFEGETADGMRDTALEIARMIGSGMYAARFSFDDSTWRVHFNDAQSGGWIEQELSHNK
jgi:hypothetical protein